MTGGHLIDRAGGAVLSGSIMLVPGLVDHIVLKGERARETDRDCKENFE